MQQQTETNVRPLVMSEAFTGVRTSAVNGSIDELVDLFTKSQAAAENFSSTIKAVSEQSGILPSVLRKLVKARAKDEVDKVKQEVEQLSLVFEECI
jgi:hypothetical protein